MAESSTKQYPTNLRESWEIQHLKNAPLPASLSQLSRGVIFIEHIDRDAHLPVLGLVEGFHGKGPLIPFVCSIRFYTGCYH